MIVAEDTGNREVGGTLNYTLYSQFGGKHGKVMLFELLELMQMTFLYEHDNTF